MTQKEIAHKHYLKNREAIIARKNQWVKNNPEKVKLSVRRIQLRKYGLTPETYEALSNEQKGNCAICGLNENSINQRGTHYRLAVDHCHDTGKVRGLLCSNCNTALGLFKDNPMFLNSAIKYLGE